jgi:hypothetical protein
LKGAEDAIGRDIVSSQWITSGDTIGNGVGLGVKVASSVDVGVSLSGIGVFVEKGVNVGGTGVEAGAHPLNKTAGNITIKNVN